MQYIIENGILYKCTVAAGETEVIIPDTVKQIGRRGKFSFVIAGDDITSVVIPESVEEINQKIIVASKQLYHFVFTGNRNLISVGKYLDGSDLMIPDVFSPYYFLSECNVVSSLSIPEKYGQTGFWCSNAPNLTEVNYSDAITIVSGGAFDRCRRLSKVHFPKNLKKIEQNAFAGCESLISLSLPDGLEVIEDYAFDGCTGLKEVALPASLQFVGKQAFAHCSPTLRLYGNVIAFKSASPKIKTSITAGWLCSGQAYTLDEDEAIAAYAKAHVSELMLVLLNGKEQAGIEKLVGIADDIPPEQLEDFIDRAIKENMPSTISSLLEYKRAHISESTEDALLSFRERTMEEWKRIFKFIKKEDGYRITKYLHTASAVEIPDEIDGTPVTSISKKCFFENNYVTSVIFGNNIRDIDDSAFERCSSLKEVQLNESLKRIGKRAFYRTALQSVRLPSQLEDLGDSAFADSPIREINIPAGVKTVLSNTFGCYSIFRPDTLHIWFDGRDTKIGAAANDPTVVIHAYPGSKSEKMARKAGGAVELIE